MKFSWFALYCGLLLSVSAFSIDILLPSLLAIGEGLQASVEHTQLVIPVYMFALGLGNPVYGAMSDRFGRRCGVIVGLGMSCFCTCFILTFLAHAPIVYASFGTEPGRFAMLFALSSVGIVLGQYVNHYFISVVGSIAATAFGGIVVAVTAMIIFLCAISGTLNEIVFSVLMFAFGTSYLIVFSNTVSLTLDPHAQRAGSASAMFGFTSYVVGSLMAGAITFMINENVVRWSACFLLIALVIASGAVYYQRKHPAQV